MNNQGIIFTFAVIFRQVRISNAAKSSNKNSIRHESKDTDHAGRHRGSPV